MLRVPEPEPVWAWVQPAAALQPALRDIPILLPPALAVELRKAPLASALPSPKPEPVFSTVLPAAVTEFAAPRAAIQLPRLTAEIEPMPVPDEPFEIPAASST